MLRPWNSWEERMKSVIFKHRKIAFTWKHLSGKQNDQKCNCNGPTEWLGVAWTVPSWSGLELSQRCKGQSANDAANRVDSCVFKVQDQVQFFSIFCGLHYSSRSWITCNSHPQKSSIFLCLSQRDHPPPWLSCRQVLWSFPAWVCRLCLSEGWSIEPQMRWHKWPVESTNPFSSSIIQPGKLCTNPISSCGDVTKFKDTPHHSTLFI